VPGRVRVHVDTVARRACAFPAEIKTKAAAIQAGGAH